MSNTDENSVKNLAKKFEKTTNEMEWGNKSKKFSVFYTKVVVVIVVIVAKANLNSI